MNECSGTKQSCPLLERLLLEEHFECSVHLEEKTLLNQKNRILRIYTQNPNLKAAFRTREALWQS